MQKSSKTRIEELTASGLWSNKTLCGYLRQQAQERPGNLAALDQPNRAQLTGDAPIRLTYAELDRVSDAMAIDLMAGGVRHRDRIMVQMPNVVDLIVCYFAVSKLGAVISPLPVQYGRHEISSLAAVLQPSWFIGMANFRGSNLADNGRFVLPASQIFSVGSDLVVRGASGISEHESSQLERYQDEFPTCANDIYSVCWTSGTTGTPKGVPRSHNMWWASGRMTASGSDYVPDDILLNPFPLVNMSALGGFLYPAVSLGCGIVLHHPLDVPVFLEQIQSENITFTIAPPALLNKLAKEPSLWSGFDFPNLRGIGSGSAPLSPEMIATFEVDYRVKIFNIYGSNEGIALISSPEAIPDPQLRAGLFPRSGGKNSPWRGENHQAVQSKVIDIDSGVELLGVGERGELCFAGPTVFDGYLETDHADLFTDDGFFRTGDLVEICGEDGEFYRIAGRLKDIINRGGMKISPAEIDTLLEGHEALAEAAVCAFSDAVLGEKICVFVVLRDPEQTVALAQICDYLTQSGVAKFKLPERLETIDALPRNPLGKVLRHELSARLEELFAG